MNREECLIEITKELQLYNKVSHHTLGNVADIIDKYVQHKVNELNKSDVMRGCDLKGKGAMLAFGLIYASNGYKGEITMDTEFISALLGEYAEIAAKASNHA